MNDTPAWEQLVKCSEFIYEDMWFGTYWITDAVGHIIEGPFNTIGDAQARIMD